MNRKALLKTALTKDENLETVLADIFEEDQDFLTKSKRDAEDKIKDLEKQLKKRFKSDTILDKSVVEVTYAGIKEAKATLELYKQFEKEYFTEGE